MKFFITSIILAITACFTLAPQSLAQADKTTESGAADDVAVSVAVADDDEAKAAPNILLENFMKLTDEQRKEFAVKTAKAQGLFNQKRIFDTLQVVDELDKIFEGHPAAMNLRGACYVEIRAFDKASPIFEKILAMSPNSINVRFNLAEINFVSKKWESAHTQFAELITLLPAGNKTMIRLCEFKLLLCKLNTNRINEAVALKDKYDEWDDSPFYYYSQAAILFHQDDKPAAEKLLRDARFVWQAAALASWQDTMIEFGYVRSFYGGDTDEEIEGSVLVKPGKAPLIQLDSE